MFNKRITIIVICVMFILTTTMLAENDWIENSESEIKRNEEKIRRFDLMQKNEKELRYIPGGEYIDIRVDLFIQEEDYFCAPACVQMVDDNINRSYRSQYEYAREMHTSPNKGTTPNNVREYLYHNVSRKYSIMEVPEYSKWMDRIYQALTYENIPVILEIDTNGVDAFPYNTSAHFIVVGGYDTRNTSGDVLVLDPHNYYGQRRWYDAADVHRANGQMWRHVMIW